MKYNYHFEKKINKVLKQYSLQNNLYSHLYSEETEESLNIKNKLFINYIAAIEDSIKLNPSFGCKFFSVILY